MWYLLKRWNIRAVAVGHGCLVSGNGKSRFSEWNESHLFEPVPSEKVLKSESLNKLSLDPVQVTWQNALSFHNKTRQAKLMKFIQNSSQLVFSNTRFGAQALRQSYKQYYPVWGPSFFKATQNIQSTSETRTIRFSNGHFLNAFLDQISNALAFRMLKTSLDRFV